MPFGTPSDNSIQYTGREQDGTGLYFYRARYYSPQLKRFISEDPIQWASGHTNYYAYANGNPLSYTDPTGEWAFLLGALVGVSIDLGFQLVSNGFNLQCVDVGSLVVSGALGAVGGWAGSLRRGSEFSHFIPARYFRPTSPSFKPWLPQWVNGPWNGSWVSNWRHYKHDPFRYSVQKGAWRNWGDKWSPAIRYLDRVPDWMKGATAGGAAGAAMGGSRKGC